MASDAFVTAMRYCLSICGAVALVENLLVMAVFAGTKKLRVKYYTFIFNLALSDFAFGLFIILVTWIDSPVLQGLLTASYYVSILTILAAAVNRYLALSIMPAARYDSLVTACRLVGACLVIWCLCLTYGQLLYNVFTTGVSRALEVYGYSVAVLVVWVVTALTYFLAFRKVKHLSPALLSPAGFGADIRQTRRLLVVFILILVTAFISWMPYAVLSLIAYYNPSLLDKPAFSESFEVAVLIYAFSTVANPLIYWWRLDSFRAGFYTMFCRCFMKAESRQTEVDPSANRENPVVETDF
ncbi:melanocyte-stimulating hormone receptor-like [Acanthaster planci]|uniref:Melanocyte-stimulating hormone receptor-like n=1 Tax=Acanthaster planci TaxID=133434 RepID=A0A8B7ZWQ1_ACAPL|nr:melanocyte-stimulating hormone receptor-like [Acanthaster planci]